MRSTFRRLLAALILTALGAAACSDAPTGGGAKVEEAKLGFSLNLANTSVNTIVVEVTAPDIATRLVFNVPVQNGVATGNITVPAGRERTVTVRAYDDAGILTHEGSKTIDVRPGGNVQISITLVPRAGEVPITVNFGDLVIVITPMTLPPYDGARAGEMYQLQATVTDPDGNLMGGAVRWASLNPAVASVDANGMVQALSGGTTEIVATYGGYGASFAFTVRGEATGGPDQTAPILLGFSLSPGSVTVGPTDTYVTLTLQARDAGSGVYSAVADLRGPNNESYQTKSCWSYPMSPAGSQTVTMNCQFSLGQYTMPGAWTVMGVAIRDGAGNYLSLNEYDLDRAGYQRTVQVSNPNADLEAPVLNRVTLSTDTVVVSGTSYTALTMTVEASDNASGVSNVDLIARSLVAPYGDTAYCWAADAGGPTYSCTTYFNSSYDAGEWRVYSIRVIDYAGNSRQYTEDELIAQGKLAKFHVVHR